METTLKDLSRYTPTCKYNEEGGYPEAIMVDVVSPKGEYVKLSDVKLILEKESCAGDNALIDNVKLKFTSGNTVPVSEARVTLKEWEAIERSLKQTICIST